MGCRAALLACLLAIASGSAAADLSLSADAEGRVSLDWKDASVGDALRLLARTGGVNLVLDAAARDKTVSLALHDVPWQQALFLVCSAQDLGATFEGNVVRVAPLTTLAAEARQLVEQREAAQESAPLTTVAFPLSWTDAAAAEQLVRRQLSPRGSTSVDRRTNTLFVTDVFDGPAVSGGLRILLARPTGDGVTVRAALVGTLPERVRRVTAVEPPGEAGGPGPAAGWRLHLQEGTRATLPDGGPSVELARDGSALVLVVRAGRLGAHVPASGRQAVALTGPTGEAVLVLETSGSSP